MCRPSDDHEEGITVASRRVDAIDAKLKFRKSRKRTLSQRHFILGSHFCVVLLAMTSFDFQIDPYFPGRLGLQAQVVGRFTTGRHGQFTFVVRDDLAEDLRFCASVRQRDLDALVFRLLVRGEFIFNSKLRV